MKYPHSIPKNLGFKWRIPSPYHGFSRIILDFLVSTKTSGSLRIFGVPSRYTWWLIPLSKWVITPVISGLTLLIPFITGVITHLLSGMSHQVWTIFFGGSKIRPSIPSQIIPKNHPVAGLKNDGWWLINGLVFLGKFTENHGFYHEDHGVFMGFPVNFP